MLLVSQTATPYNCVVLCIVPTNSSKLGYCEIIYQNNAIFERFLLSCVVVLDKWPSSAYNGCIELKDSWGDGVECLGLGLGNHSGRG